MPITKSITDIPNYIFTIPSKTFIFGEYAALERGDALLVTTEPNFQVAFKPAQPGMRIDSSVKQLLSSYQLGDWMPVCQDPYDGLGGFGASSALFLSAYHLCQLQQKSPQLDDQSVWRVFQQFHPAISGYYPPSGYDILAQHQGGLVSITHGQVSLQHWPFDDFCLGLIHTRRRSVTADQLTPLDAKQMSHIKAISRQCLQDFHQQSKALFIESMKRFWQAMITIGRADDQSIDWCYSLETIAGVLAAKGCGALGYDVLLVCYERLAQPKIDQQCQCWGLTWYPDVKPAPSYRVHMRQPL